MASTNRGCRDAKPQAIIVRQRRPYYLLNMAETAHHKVSKCSASARSSARGRFLAIASLKPATKRANISSAQTDKAVGDYLDSHAR